MDPGSLTAVAVLAFGGGLVVVCLLGLFFVHSGPRRAGLLAAVLPLALIVPTFAVGYGSFSLINAFSQMALTGEGGSTAVLDHCRRVWTIVRIAAGVVAGVALVALPLGLVAWKERSGAPSCSGRRAALLLAMPLCALALTAGLVAQLQGAIRVIQIVVAPTDDDAQKAEANRRLAAEGLGLEGAAGIAAISQHIAIRATIGGPGAWLVLVVLLGLSLTGSLLAAPVRMGGGAAAAAALVWLIVAALGAAVALGVSSAGSSP